MFISCIRGATTVSQNTKDEILNATDELLKEIIRVNDLNIDQILSILFTATADLDAVYPAVAARNMGITDSSLMCMQEMNVKNSLDMCIRVIVQIQCDKKADKHIYMRNATVLRPDLNINKFSIAIDGPAGSGKSTIARIIAEKLGIIYIDTGAMYRAVALYFINMNKSFDTAYIISQLENINISLVYIDNKQHILLNDRDVSLEIRSSEVTEGSSIVSRIPEVREKLVFIQRNLSKRQSIIMDGRDIGTHVLPNANLKIYLVADIDERVKRRCDDYLSLGKSFNAEEIKSAMIKRDFEDMHRKASPLRKAETAIEIDTTSLTIGEAVKEILSHLKI